MAGWDDINPRASRRVKESKGEQATVNWAAAHGIKVTKTVAVGQRGWPDRTFWLAGGRPLMIEFKAAGEVPRKLQQHIHEQLQELGYDIETHDSAESAIASIRRHMAARETGKKNGQDN